MTRLPKILPREEKIPLLRPWIIEPEELLSELKEIIASGKLSLGIFTQKLEEAIQRALGVKNAILVSSGTSGLILVLKALGIKGKVVVPAFTFPATSHSVLWAGAKVKFCDVNLDDFTISLSELEQINDPEIEAVIAVNVFGLPPRIEELEQICRKRGWKLIFDSAQGLGSEYKGEKTGRFGWAEIFSLSPSKVITAGEGGVITTNDSELAHQLRSLRNYGKSHDGSDIIETGLSVRMSEFNALIAYHNFSHLEELINLREDLIKNYQRAFANKKGIEFQKTDNQRRSACNYFVLRITEQAPISCEELYLKLQEQGIESKRYFYPPAHKIRAYLDWQKDSFPNSELLSEQCLALPLYPGLEAEEQERIIKTINYYLGER